MAFFARHAYVVRRYLQLQGLELLPLAALFWVAFARGLGWVRLPGDGQPNNGARWFLGGLAVVFAATLWSRAWYRKRYSTAGQLATASATRPILLVTAFLILAFWIQQAARLPFSLPILLLGTALAVVGIGDYPLRRHYLAAAAVLIGFAFLGPLGISQPVRSILFDAAMALALTIVGAGDHLLIVTTLHDTSTLDDTRNLQEVRADV